LSVELLTSKDSFEPWED